MSVEAQTVNEPPPSYTSESPSSTLTYPSDPPISEILKPNHSTCAARLAYAMSRGRCSRLEYLESTFSIMVIYHHLRTAVVVSIDEDFSTLTTDIARIFNNRLLPRSGIKELRINWHSGSGDFGSNFHLTQGNGTAMLRLLKSRGGVDVIIAK